MTTKSRKIQGVSFEPKILNKAKVAAAKKRMSLSAYINQIISDDLGCQLFATTPSMEAGSNSAKTDEGGES